MNPAANTIDSPAESEIRTGLDLIIASPTFRASPTLTCFLRFIVERTLAGDSAHLKGYTIAVEAFGRGVDFDPQADPIVRVEAGRLRRRLAQFYAGDGAREPVLIDLPRGGYVPTFHRRTIAAGDAARESAIMPAAGRTIRISLPVAAVIAVVVAAGLLEIFALWPRTMGATAGFELVSAHRLARPVFPVVVVRPFSEIGAPAAAGFSAEALRRKLSDVLARFDEIEVRAAAESPSVSSAAPQPDYRLAGTVDYRADGGASLTLRLADTSADMKFWSRTYVLTGAGADDVIANLAAALAQPYSVIHSRNQAKRAAGHQFDSRFACLLDSFDAWPRYDAARDNDVRTCLQRETARDLTFSAGLAALSTIYLREHMYGYGARSGDAPALDRALSAAQRAVAVKPESARAHQALMDVHFARGDLDQVTAAGDRAAMLNPYDTYVLGTYGMRLIFMGDADRGLPMLQTFMEHRKGSSGRAVFALFLGNYLLGDYKAAKFYAHQVTSEGYPLVLLARTLAAQARGDQAKARTAYKRLTDFDAAWSEDPREVLARFFPAPAVVDLLADALAAASHKDGG
jgi:tetratricopeptide (TPR) repeat protein